VKDSGPSGRLRYCGHGQGLALPGQPEAAAPAGQAMPPRPAAQGTAGRGGQPGAGTIVGVSGKAETARPWPNSARRRASR
jgi:hypothetical protein